MVYQMMRVKNWQGQGDIGQFCKDFKLAACDIGVETGMVPGGLVPSKDGPFVLVVAEEQIERLLKDYPDQIEGPFSDIIDAFFEMPVPKP